MTAREYAKECGIELVGKLTRKIDITTEWSWSKCEEVEKKTVYWVDEVGNTLTGNKGGGWCLATPDGEVY